MAMHMLTAGKLVFAAMAVAVGVRLARKARSHGFWGLHSVALGAICVGGIGMLLEPLAEARGSLPLMIAAESGIRTGMFLLCFFIAATFRHTRGGYAGASLCAVFLVAAIVWDLLAQPPTGAYDYGRISSHANQASIAIPFLWAALESRAHWVRGRRRVALDLADPLVVRTYLIWSVTTACFVGICALAIFAGVASAAGIEGPAAIAHALRGVLYLAVSAGIWLGLFHKPAPAAESPHPPRMGAPGRA
jgi:hypothetical protein